MNKEQLRKIDALIAEHITGANGRKYRLLPYSTDFWIAWKMLETINPLWFHVGRENCSGIRYDCIIYNDYDLEDKVNATADTPALAICLAVLEWKGVKYD